MSECCVFILAAHLDWGLKEQSVFWRLALVHRLPIDFILGVLPKLESKSKFNFKLIVYNSPCVIINVCIIEECLQ